MFVISLSTFLIRTEQIIFHCVHLDHTAYKHWHVHHITNVIKAEIKRKEIGISQRGE